jgi:nitronate monooxygenase
MTAVRDRTQSFCDRFGLAFPILEAPMAGACTPVRSAAIANAGGMGALGALLLAPDEITAWVAAFRKASAGPLQINIWIPDPPPERNTAREAQVREFLSEWGPPVPEGAGDQPLRDFEAQCEAMLAARPAAVSSIMGLFDPDFAARLKAAGIAWFATATTLAEALAAESAGADAVIAQGFEAGGHRGTFDPVEARTNGIGLLAFLPVLADRLSVPIIAAGGIGDGRGVAAALTLGASAAMIGTGFLRCPEGNTPPAWSNRLGGLAPEDTRITRAFSGRPGRAIATPYVQAATAPDAPDSAPYPIQRSLTAAMRAFAVKQNDVQRMQAWSGQAGSLARAEPAGHLVQRLWQEADLLLPQ